jgi:uncharacterized protein YkwD
VRSKILRRAGWCTPVLAVLMAGSPAYAAATCGTASSTAGLGAAPVRTTTLCLLNAKRDAHALAPLRVSGKLARAARRHSRDMVRHGYFAHDSRSGVAFSARIAATGWMRDRDAWSVGENLAWGGGPRAAPAAIVAAWMASPAHRRNILDRRFHTIGIGVAAGLPVAAGGAGATYTTDFGS